MFSQHIYFSVIIVDTFTYIFGQTLVTSFGEGIERDILKLDTVHP